MKEVRRICTTLLSVLLLISSGNVLGGEVSVAVASNALQAMKDIKNRFEKNTGNTVLISSGSTGKLYTQIVNGAPFDIFLAANAREPERLEQAKAIVPGSRITYAVGRLVLWNNVLKNNTGKPISQLLSTSEMMRFTLANPKTAPYGFAAKQFLQGMKLWGLLQGKLIQAENVSQAFQFIQSQNVQMGFVALSQIKGYKGHINKSDYWLVPQKYYTPIEQQGVLLSRAATNAVARQFMEYLKSPEVKLLLQEHYGYGA